jgi:glutaredoxin
MNKLKKIVVYSADFCGYCTKTKEWLESQKLPFTTKDVTLPEVQAEFDKYKSPGVPLILITDEATGQTEEIKGFNVEKLTATLL